MLELKVNAAGPRAISTALIVAMTGGPQLWKPCASTETGCHSFQVASRDS